MRACCLAVATVGCSLATVAQESASETARPLVEQKLKLLESLLTSPRMAGIEAGDDATAKTLVEEAKALAAQSRQAFDAGDLSAAGTAADAAMRSAAAAARGTPPAAVDAGRLRTRHAELLRQIRGYRAKIADAWATQAGADIDRALARLDRLIAEAEELGRADRHADAIRLLAEAYKAAVTLVSKQSAGQTVVYRLNFATPADEYAYEQERHRSHVMLVELALAERGIGRNAVGAFLDKSDGLRTQAESAAGQGRYEAAIGDMERATQQLVRALQSLGVPISQ